jgi:hypothetical protein
VTQSSSNNESDTTDVKDGTNCRKEFELSPDIEKLRQDFRDYYDLGIDEVAAAERLNNGLIEAGDHSRAIAVLKSLFLAKNWSVASAKHLTTAFETAGMMDEAMQFWEEEHCRHVGTERLEPFEVRNHP